MNERSVFEAALEISDPAERAAYLDRACAADAGLRRRVGELIAAHTASGSFMAAPAAGEGTAHYEPLSEGPGTRIGPYKLLQAIGEGGMGAVFMAEQEEPVRRKVAVKIIKPGMDSKQVVARFEAERQALSMMDHPNIAKVLDAGTTDAGRPYFVMELVHGVPITEFCDANRLTTRERLALFVPVCQAIQHAHQKGIIHRDIKPSNILVTMYDDKPVPKVIDFGVAKAIEQRLTERTLFTQYGALVGTFEYMSPEQAEMNAFGVDTRSDVYALGVLLYELLTGTTPLERKRLRTAALNEVVRLIREEEPPRPSARLSTSGQLAKVAAARKTEPGKISSLVRGELDWVVMKCLEKDRARRYQTANGLARDVERYLAGDAVEAYPPTLGYRLHKAYRRNRTAVLTVGLIAGALLAGTLVSAWQAVVASAAKRDADVQREAADAKRLEAEAAEGRMRGAERSGRFALADTFAAFGKVAAERGDPGLASLWYAKAATLVPDAPDQAASHRLLASAWQDRALQPVATLRTDYSFIREVNWHPAGAYLFAYSQSDDLKKGTGSIFDLGARTKWECRTLGEPVTKAAWNRVGDRVALATEKGTVVLADFPNGTVSHTISVGPEVRAVSWSPDGNWLAVGSGQSAALYDAATGKQKGDALKFNEPVYRVTFGPRSDRFVVTTSTTTVSTHHLFSIDQNGAALNPEAIRSPTQFRGLLYSVVGRDGASNATTERTTFVKQVSSFEVLEPVFVENGATFATNSTTRNEVAFWSSATGRLVRTARVVPESEALPEVPTLYQWGQLALSPDGRYLHAFHYYYHPAVLMDVATGTLTRARVQPALGTAILSASFHPNGRTVATVGTDRALCFWSVPTGEARDGTVRLPFEIHHVRYSPDGRALAVGMDCGEIRVYRTPGGEARQSEIDFVNGTDSLVRLSRDGALLLPTGNTRRMAQMGATRPYFVATGKPAGEHSFEPGGVITDGDLSPTELVAAIGTSHPSHAVLPYYNESSSVLPGRFHLWNWKDGQKRPPIELPGEPRSVVFAPDGRSAAVLCSDGHVVRIDVARGAPSTQKRVRPSHHSNNHYHNNGHLRYHPDGRTLWVYSGEDRARCLDANTLEQRFELRHLADVLEVNFSNDGRFVSTASKDGTARVWDAATGEPLCRHLAHPNWAFRAAFSPDGTKLLTSARDTTARMWDWRNEKELFSVQHQHEINAVAFTPDGRHIVSGSADRTARVWDAATGKALTAPLALPSFALQAHVTPDGRRAVVGGLYSRVQILDLAKLVRPAALSDEDAILWGELLANRRVENGSTFNLTAEQWAQRWDRVAQRRSEFFPAAEDAALATHRREARVTVAAQQWVAALGHLNELHRAAPTDQSVLLHRGHVLAELGRWDAAHADYASARKLGSLPAHEVQALVLLAHRKGDRARAGELLTRWAEEVCARDDPPAAALVLWTFALLENVPVEAALLGRATDSLNKYAPKYQWLRVANLSPDAPKGLRTFSPIVPYLLRAGRAGEAWARLQRELSRGPDGPLRRELDVWEASPDSEAHALLALVYARRGDSVRAEVALGRARELTKPEAALAEWTGVPGKPWNERLIRTLLLEEAELAVAHLRANSGNGKR